MQHARLGVAVKSPRSLAASTSAIENGLGTVSRNKNARLCQHGNNAGVEDHSVS